MEQQRTEADRKNSIIPVSYGVGTIMECCGKFLILKRAESDSHGGKWGLPAGGVEEDEETASAAAREVFEESGYTAKEEELEYVGHIEWRRPESKLHFSIYRIRLKELFEVRLDPKEHSEFKWVSPEECYAMQELIDSFKILLEKYYGIKKDKE